MRRLLLMLSKFLKMRKVSKVPKVIKCLLRFDSSIDCAYTCVQLRSYRLVAQPYCILPSLSLSTQMSQFSPQPQASCSSLFEQSWLGLNQAILSNLLISQLRHLITSSLNRIMITLRMHLRTLKDFLIFLNLRRNFLIHPFHFHPSSSHLPKNTRKHIKKDSHNVYPTA